MSDKFAVVLLVGGPFVGGLVVGLAGWRWPIAPAVGAAIGLIGLSVYTSTLPADEQVWSGGFILLIFGAGIALAAYAVALGVRKVPLLLRRRRGAG
jgi:MFS family permease